MDILDNAKVDLLVGYFGGCVVVLRQRYKDVDADQSARDLLTTIKHNKTVLDAIEELYK